MYTDGVLTVSYLKHIMYTELSILVVSIVFSELVVCSLSQ